MTIRHIQTTGGSSYFITLPKDWVIRNKVKAKDPLNIFQTNNNSLVINKENDSKNQIEISVDKISNSQLAREIIAFYVAGNEKIVLNTSTYFSIETRKIIRDQLKLVMGYELYEENSKKITINNISNINIPPNIQVIKMIKNITSMFEDFEIAIKNKYIDLAEDIIARDDEVDKTNLHLTKFLIENLNNFGVNNGHTISLVNVFFYQQQSLRLERIADHIVKASKQIIKTNNYQLEEYVKKGILICKKYLKSIEELLLANNKDVANNILDEFNELKNKTDKNHKFDEFNTVISNCVERIISYCANISEDFINIYKK